MNRIIPLLIFLLPVVACSQDFTGVVVGVGYSTIKGDEIAAGVSVSGKITVNVGIKTEVKFSDRVFLMFGMEYNGKGYKAKDATHTNNLSMGYIQFPVALVYKLPIGEEANNQILFGAGPYVALGIHYKSQYTVLSPVMGLTEGEESGNFADYGMRVTDFGLNALAGIQIGRKIQILANYQPGFVNVFYSADFGLVKNRRMGLQVTYVW